MRKNLFSKKGDWYFEGYRSEFVPADNRRGRKRTFIYTGDYYSFGFSPEKLRFFKAKCAILYAVTLCLYLVMTGLSFIAAAFFYVGIPSVLAIIPLIYLGMGVVCLCMAPDKMTIRVRYGSVRRCKRAVSLAMAFLSLSLVGDVFFLIRYFGHYLLLHELLFLILNIGSLITLTLIWYQFKQHPLQLVE